jgi:hypothetical protein
MIAALPRRAGGPIPGKGTGANRKPTRVAQVRAGPVGFSFFSTLFSGGRIFTMKRALRHTNFESSNKTTPNIH